MKEHLMLTPSKYWRVACSLESETPPPPATYPLPQELAEQAKPPTSGHGIAIAAYDETEQTGILRWIGVVTGGVGPTRAVDWRPVNAQIGVDSEKGRSYWRAGGFGFASKKTADYGLHELWQEHFEGMVLRDQAPMSTRPRGPRPSLLQLTQASPIAPERLNPIEVIGEPTVGARAGVVYLLKSAYGYKVGRTRNVPARMRAFGVQLPFLYTVLLCAWFDDCHEAERRYHNRFAEKRINGEWFDLEQDDIEAIRLRA